MLDISLVRLTCLVPFLVTLTSLASDDPPCVREFTPATGSFNFTRSDTVALSNPSLIGTIHLTRLPVFDETNPREDHMIYRLGNRFHRVTKPSVISSLLLFSTGDEFQPRLLDESARLLRTEDYLYDAHIRPVSNCDGQVDVEVITRDVWSFTPDLSFDRSGGENTYRFSIRDTNILGTGTEATLSRRRDTDRDSYELQYKNTHLRGSRVQGQVRLADSDDGNEQFLYLSQPFYALDTRKAWELRLRRFDRTNNLYDRGEKISAVAHKTEDYLVALGRSKGLEGSQVRRWTFGYRYLAENFEQSAGLPSPEVFPDDKRLSQAYIQYASLENRYTTAVNLDQLHRTEDLHLGHHLFTRVGAAPTALGSDENRISLEVGFRDALIYDGRQYLRHRMSLTGLWNFDRKRTEDLVVDYRLDYFHRQTRHRSFVLRMSGTYSHNLSSHRQIVLGGDSGVRAFDNRFQTGDRRWLLQLEERMYTDMHLFNLIRVGWAVFVDVGKAWKPGKTDSLGTLANAGVGLRLASSKSSIGRVVHVDLSFPISNRDEPGVDSSQISVNMRTGL